MPIVFGLRQDGFLRLLVALLTPKCLIWASMVSAYSLSFSTPSVSISPSKIRFLLVFVYCDDDYDDVGRLGFVYAKKWLTGQLLKIRCLNECGYFAWNYFQFFMTILAAPKGLFPPEPEMYRGPKLKVAIIGAGLAGMSTAVELLDQGHEVHFLLVFIYPMFMLIYLLNHSKM